MSSNLTERQLTEVYSALARTGQLHSGRVRCMSYRCVRDRCLLLDVFELPGGEVAIAVPRHKTSPVVTEQTSTPAGRAANTENGFNQWAAYAGYAQNWSRPSLACDHLRSVVLENEWIAEDWNAGRVEVMVRQDGSRFQLR